MERGIPAGVLKQIKPGNILSFGPETEPLALENLNVLIGTNGAGKSNLLETVDLMRNTQRDIRGVVRRGGGIKEWVWKGEKEKSASVEFIVDNPHDSEPLRHIISFRSGEQGLCVDDERIENKAAYSGEIRPYFYYRFDGGNPVVNEGKKRRRKLVPAHVDMERSILAQLRDSRHPIVRRFHAISLFAGDSL